MFFNPPGGCWCSWRGALPVRKVRLSSSVHFVSTGRDGRTQPLASQTPARTLPEPDASGGQTGRKCRQSPATGYCQFNVCRIHFCNAFKQKYLCQDTEITAGESLIACSIFKKVFAKPSRKSLVRSQTALAQHLLPCDSNHPVVFFLVAIFLPRLYDLTQED